jgi:hypothetical protein
VGLSWWVKSWSFKFHCRKQNHTKNANSRDTKDKTTLSNCCVIVTLSRAATFVIFMLNEALTKRCTRGRSFPTGLFSGMQGTTSLVHSA